MGAGGSTMTMTVGSGATLGTSTITVTGSSGAITHTTTIQLTVTSAQAWFGNFDFRATQGFVTDPSGNNAVLGVGTLYPTTANNVTFGWTIASALQTRDRVATGDPRLAGLTFVPNNAPPAVFQVSLPTPGAYSIRLAAGDQSYPQCVTQCRIEFRDGNTSLFVQTFSGVPAGSFADAYGQVWSAAAWQASNAARQITMTGTQLTVLIGANDGVADNTTLAFLGVAPTVSGGAPIATLSPTTLSFGSQNVGTTSAAQPVTLANTGSANLNITGIVPSGDFAETSNCPAFLAPSASCIVNVMFRPTTSGTRTGKITINDNAANSPQQVSLSGTAVAPVATLSPANLTFASQVVGTTSPKQVVTLTNTGSAGLNIASIGTSGDYAQTNNCPLTLAISASCNVSVTFTPTTTGTRAGTVTFNDNAPNSPQSVGSTGTGITGTQLVIHPHQAPLTVGQQIQFVANLSASWSVDGIANGNSSVGVMSSSGLYTAPSVAGTHTVTASASGMIDSAQVYVSSNSGTFTYHNDNARTGLNANETILTPQNVNSAQFGKLLSVALDGYAYTQPLYVANLNIGGGVHNVIYVATEHDSVYAIDADSGTVLWQISLIPPGGSTVSAAADINPNCTDIVPEIGVTGTPVIDPATATIYLVAVTKENGSYFQRLHAIDLVNHSEKFGGPIVIQPSYSGQGDGSNGTVVNFDPHWQRQRTALLLQNGQVSIGWASYCDGRPYHGWVANYNASTLAQVGVFNISPNTNMDGVWMSGGGLAGDSSFNTYFSTGNGPFDGVTEFGDSILKLGAPSNGLLPLLDWFTPWDQSALAGSDDDLGAGGILLLPDQPVGSPHQHLLVTAGKDGTMLLIDRDNMGHYCSTCNGRDTQIVQEFGNIFGPFLATPGYWNGNLYFGATARPVQAFSFNGSSAQPVSTSPTSSSPSNLAWGATPSISSNGTSSAIVWTLDYGSFANSCCAILHAYDATNLANELYNSSQAANNRDAVGGAVKFTVPTVVNGKVFVGTQNQLVVYGLLPQ
jgi:hypothetical protein